MSVQSVFDAVADRYDLMNSLMSFGLHILWKRKFIAMIETYHTYSLLDVAGGTGDIAMGFLNAGGQSAIICDINENMLEAGNQQRIQRGTFNRYKDRLSTVCGDAQNLPFDDNSFDRVTISFGIRNVENIQQALNEMYRVLKPGGKFLCMEFLRPESNSITRKLYDFFSFHCIPLMGKVVIGDSKPYEYLVNSIRKFPKKHDFVQMIHNAKFDMVKTHILMNDVVAIYTGYKID